MVCHIEKPYSEQQLNRDTETMTKIRIYYHVTLIGKYFDITLDIFDEIERSGLMDECEGIYIGVLGDAKELQNFMELIERYPKAKVINYHTDKQYYEWHTISKIKEDADNLPRFYALYLHSKGVTSENENDSKFRQFWADYMTYWMVTKWKQWYHALDLRDLDDHYVGYDASAVRVVPARKSIGHTTHGSGNFWSANSEYIKTLKLVKENTYYDGQNPYTGGHSAETWVWSGQPIIYTPCQMFQIGFPFQEKTFKQFWEELPNKEKYIL